MARKNQCRYTSCRHHCNDGGCDMQIKIGPNGKCESFEKGIVYYVRLVWAALGNNNFIDMVRMTSDLRIGLYYVMELFHLGYSEKEWGTWRLISLQDGADGPALNYEAIIAREIDTERLAELTADLNAGKLPGPKPDVTQKQERGEKADFDFGWVSPSGDFTESPFGSHEESAEAISNTHGWETEYFAWRKTRTGQALYRDFLVEIKHYCLIHNPSLDGGYIVTHKSPLTKRQREFLYEYFMDKGDRFKGEMYLQEG